MSHAPAISPSASPVATAATGKAKGEAAAPGDEFAALLAGVTVATGEAAPEELTLVIDPAAAEGEQAERGVGRSRPAEVDAAIRDQCELRA